MSKRKKSILIIALVCGLVGVLIVSLGYRYIVNRGSQSSEEIESVKEKLRADEVGYITSNLEDNQDIFNTLISTGSILAGSGDPEAAEEYYVAALEHAKSMQDQDTIDSGYRVLLAYYKEYEHVSKYDGLTAEIGEDGLKRIHKLDPRDEGIE